MHTPSQWDDLLQRWEEKNASVQIIKLPKIRLESLTSTLEGEIKDEKNLAKLSSEGEMIDEKTGENDEKETGGENIRDEENDEERVNISDKFTQGVWNYS